MLSFLIGLVLLFSTVQNNCDGANATLQEQMEIIKAMPQGEQGGGVGLPLVVIPCTNASECPQGKGCFFQNNQGGCLECSFASQAPHVPGVTFDGCKSGTGGGGDGGGGADDDGGGDDGTGGKPGSDSKYCETTSDCKDKPGGPYGCVNLAGATRKSCVSCVKAGMGRMAPPGVLNVDGCSRGQGQGLNTM